MTPFVRSTSSMQHPDKVQQARRPARKARTQAVVAARMAEKRFVKSVMSVRLSPETEKRNAELVQRTRAAKSAHFLEQYKIAA